MDGAPLPPEIKCRDCGELMEAGGFCPSCGARTETTRLAAHPAATGGKAMDFAIETGPTASMGSLVVTNADGGRGPTYPLALMGNTSVGRSEGEVTFADDRYMSPKHLVLEGDGRRVIARDLGSFNGTYLRLKGSALLPPGAMLMVGRQVLRVARVAPQPPKIHTDETVLNGSESRAAVWAMGQIVMSGAVREIYAVPPPGITVGRQGCDVNFPRDTFVSTQHARLEPLEAAVRLTDLDSSNGTWVRLTKPVEIGHGTQLMVGKIRLSVLLPQLA